MSACDPEALLDLADEAARAAGALLVARFGGPREGVASKSTPTDLVSEADLEAERAILELLERRRPEDAVLAEEGGAGHGRSGLRWVIDPLDGTINFLYGIPQWAVSIACEDADGAIAGVVHDPVRGETFAAFRDGPATLNGTQLVHSGREELGKALVATGFAYDAEMRERQARIAARALPQVRDLRRLGSAALDLVWTAAGRYDAYYEFGVQPWDIAAGTLVCSRAGVELRNIEPAAGLDRGLVAASPAIADDLLALVTP